VDDLDKPMTAPPAADAARGAWLALLTRAATAELEAAFDELTPSPAHQCLRPPEVGMLMLRGRIGGSGDPFNFGEATVTRCAVRVGDKLGIGYTLGRERRKAELIAVFDALLQDEAQAPQLRQRLLEPLARRRQAQRDAASRAAASSKVEFFTLVRGET
jgi:alpha-D-ribose 1-methylphosphonate 5-triphosphate synthase subunit PhnG